MEKKTVQVLQISIRLHTLLKTNDSFGRDLLNLDGGGGGGGGGGGVDQK